MLLKAFRNFMIKRTISAKLRNKGMNTFSNYEILKNIRDKAEKLRKQEGRSHEVLYFHKVDDPYSSLTVEYLDKIQSSFDITLKPILVGEEDSEAIHEPSLYNIYCLEDAKRIAPYYGVDFTPTAYPEKELVELSNSILTAVTDEKFSEIAKKVSIALWHGDLNSLEELSKEYSATKLEVSENLDSGNSIRNENLRK